MAIKYPFFQDEYLTHNAKETVDLGRELAKTLITNQLPRIVCLYGELGSGKTTFAQGFAQGLGLENRLLSPTFIIVRRYNLLESVSFFYHLDLYRLKTQAELNGLGLSEIFSDAKSFALIEWAEKLDKYLPLKRIDIQFVVLDNESHQIKIAVKN